MENAAKDNLINEKLLNRNFYPSANQTNPALNFHPSPYSNAEKIAELKNFAFDPKDIFDSKNYGGGN